MATSKQINDLVSLYVGYFDRAPDPAGLQFWIEQIDNGREFNTIAADFAASAEATALYPYLTTPAVSTPSAFITSVYQNLFNRAPDDAGLKFWTDVLESKSVSVADMIEAIINGAQGDDKTIMENKVEVGLDFAVDAGNTAGFTFDAAAKAAAVAAVDGVTADPATVAAAKAATDAFLGSSIGETLGLTVGVDDIAGTKYDDTINALSVNAATGADATTLSSFDKIDGGAGTDTLNVYMSTTPAGSYNASLPASTSVENVEIINLNSTDGTGFNTGVADTIDASKFKGATQIWQDGLADVSDVIKLQASTTAGIRNANATTLIKAAAAATSASIALDTAAAGTLTVTGAALNAVNLSGTVDGAQGLTMNLAAGEETATLNASLDKATNLTVNGVDLAAVDASASTSGVNYIGGKAVEAISTGAGADMVTIRTATEADDKTTAADETVTASLVSGAGDDTLVVSTSGTGAATVDAGEGDDMITLSNTNTGGLAVKAGAGDDTVVLDNGGTAGKLTIDLGEGDDAFMVDSGAVSKGDVVDGGAGTDTLQLTSVGSANINAFSNFEVFDAKNLNVTLDANILAANNTVTEFVASDDVGANGKLTNLGAGVGFRATGDMDGTDIELVQKTAGALDVTMDVDSTSTTAANAAEMAVVAVNAKSVNAVFASDSAYTKGTNLQEMDLRVDAATSVSVVSGGDNSTNHLDLVDTNNTVKTVTITGSQELGAEFIGTTNLASIDASGLTGDLTIDLNELANNGTLTLGAGADKVTVAADSNAGGVSADADIEAIAGFEKTDAAAVGGDAVAANAAIADADKMVITGASVADANGGVTTATISNGVLTFSGAGPTTLDGAVAIANSFADAVGESLLFEYVGDSYVFTQGASLAASVAADDILVKMVGLTGVSNFAETGVDNFFVV